MYTRKKTNWRPRLEALEVRQLLSADLNLGGFEDIAVREIRPDTPTNTRDGEDSDGDGLLDTWETNGIDINNDGTIDLDLPALGAKLDHKDIFVEMDYLEAAGHTHKPDLQQDGTPLSTNPLQDVADAFANSPVSNPDGVTGITLHYTIDEPLFHSANINFAKTPGAADDFYDFKWGSNDPNNLGTPCGTGALDGHFGSVADRSSPNCANILEARRAVYHYSLSIHFITGAPGASGIAELHGNDFIVALGSSKWSNAASVWSGKWGTSFDAEWKDIYARTFMHELGHNLGLGHGGADSGNGKPNYLSVMNYSRLLNYSGSAVGIPGVPDGTRVRVNPALDYSRAALPDLNESSLNESVGVGGAGTELTLFGYMGTARVAPTSGPVDWNLDGAILTDSTADLNELRALGMGKSPGELMHGHDDWSNIDYNFRDNPAEYADGNGVPGAGAIRHPVHSYLVTASFDFDMPINKLNKRHWLGGRR